MAFHGEFDVDELSFDEYAKRLYSLMEILNVESEIVGLIIERNPLVLRSSDVNCIKRWEEINKVGFQIYTNAHVWFSGEIDHMKA